MVNKKGVSTKTIVIIVVIILIVLFIWAMVSQSPADEDEEGLAQSPPDMFGYDEMRKVDVGEGEDIETDTDDEIKEKIICCLGAPGWVPEEECKSDSDFFIQRDILPDKSCSGIKPPQEVCCQDRVLLPEHFCNGDLGMDKKPANKCSPPKP